MVESLVEMFKQPFSWVQENFRTSELVLLAWRSREKASQMEKRFKKVPPPAAPPARGMRTNLPASVLDEDGAPDVSKMTSNQMLAHLASVGFHIPMGPMGPGK